MQANLTAQQAEVARSDAMGVASSAAGLATGAALGGGIGLIEGGAGLAMQASGVGSASGQVAVVHAGQRAALARGEAYEREARAGTEVDLPYQARALLTVLDSGRSSVAWRNPRTGKSGTIQITQMSGGRMPGVDECRSATSMRNNDDSEGYLNLMLVCKRAGEWWLVN
jgi:hypothetical protein